MANLELLRSLVKPLNEKELKAIEAFDREMAGGKIAIEEMKKSNQEWEKNVLSKMAEKTEPVNFFSTDQEIIVSLVNYRRRTLYEEERALRCKALRDLNEAINYEANKPSCYHRKELLACLDDEAALKNKIRVVGNYFSISFQMLGRVERRTFQSVHLSHHYVPLTRSLGHGVACWPTKGGHAIEGNELDIVKIGK